MNKLFSLKTPLVGAALNVALAVFPLVPCPASSGASSGPGLTTLRGCSLPSSHLQNLVIRTPPTICYLCEDLSTPESVGATRSIGAMAREPALPLTLPDGTDPETRFLKETAADSVLSIAWSDYALCLNRPCALRGDHLRASVEIGTGNKGSRPPTALGARWIPPPNPRLDSQDERGYRRGLMGVGAAS